MSSQRWIIRVTVKPAANSSGRDEGSTRSRSFKSPTLKPKEHAPGAEPYRSVEIDTPGSQDQEKGDDDQREARDAVCQNADLLQRATAQARIGLERGGQAALRAEGVADEFIGNVDRKISRARRIEIQTA